MVVDALIYNLPDMMFTVSYDGRLLVLSSMAALFGLRMASVDKGRHHTVWGQPHKYPKVWPMSELINAILIIVINVTLDQCLNFQCRLFGKRYNIFCLEKQCRCRAIPVQCLPWLSRNVCSTYLRTLHNTRLSFPQLESSSSSPLLSSSFSSSFCRALDCSFWN